MLTIALKVLAYDPASIWWLCRSFHVSSSHWWEARIPRWLGPSSSSLPYPSFLWTVDSPNCLCLVYIVQTVIAAIPCVVLEVTKLDSAELFSEGLIPITIMMLTWTSDVALFHWRPPIDSHRFHVVFGSGLHDSLHSAFSLCVNPLLQIDKLLNVEGYLFLPWQKLHLAFTYWRGLNPSMRVFLNYFQ